MTGNRGIQRIMTSNAQSMTLSRSDCQPRIDSLSSLKSELMKNDVFYQRALFDWALRTYKHGIGQLELSLDDTPIHASFANDNDWKSLRAVTIIADLLCKPYKAIGDVILPPTVSDLTVYRLSNLPNASAASRIFGMGVVHLHVHGFSMLEAAHYWAHYSSLVPCGKNLLTLEWRIQNESACTENLRVPKFVDLRDVCPALEDLQMDVPSRSGVHIFLPESLRRLGLHVLYSGSTSLVPLPAIATQHPGVVELSLTRSMFPKEGRVCCDENEVLAILEACPNVQTLKVALGYITCQNASLPTYCRHVTQMTGMTFTSLRFDKLATASRYLQHVTTPINVLLMGGDQDYNDLYRRSDKLSEMVCSPSVLLAMCNTYASITARINIHVVAYDWTSADHAVMCAILTHRLVSRLYIVCLQDDAVRNDDVNMASMSDGSIIARELDVSLYSIEASERYLEIAATKFAQLETLYMTFDIYDDNRTVVIRPTRPLPSTLRTLRYHLSKVQITSEFMDTIPLTLTSLDLQIKVHYDVCKTDFLHQVVLVLQCSALWTTPRVRVAIICSSLLALSASENEEVDDLVARGNLLHSTHSQLQRTERMTILHKGSIPSAVYIFSREWPDITVGLS